MKKSNRDSELAHLDELIDEIATDGSGWGCPRGKRAWKSPDRDLG
jgi:hypothetical protein